MVGPVHGRLIYRMLPELHAVPKDETTRVGT